eukprot:365027-Chlamydomonas_euryale.AAC.3
MLANSLGKTWGNSLGKTSLLTHADSSEKLAAWIVRRPCFTTWYADQQAAWIVRRPCFTTWYADQQAARIIRRPCFTTWYAAGAATRKS